MYAYRIQQVSISKTSRPANMFVLCLGISNHGKIKMMIVKQKIILLIVMNNDTANLILVKQIILLI